MNSPMPTNPAHLRKIREIAALAAERFAGTESAVKARALVAEVDALLAKVSP